MSKKQGNQLGLFWGEEKLNFVEVLSTSPVKAFSVKTGDHSVQSSGVSSGGKFIPAGVSDEYNLSPIVSNSLLHQNITSSSINLSLPAKDIIFRSFILPWMQQSEIKNVVEFEASKYVPFSLDELYYSYHAMTVSISGAKKIRIIFVAIKKETLDKFIKVLLSANLTIDSVEPSPMSMIRALTLKNLLPQDKIVAIIQKENNSGKIYVVEKGIPLFVREFQLRIPAGQKDTGPKALMMLFINEIRISLDYFNRQNNQVQAKEIILITTSGDELAAKTIEDNIKLPVASVNISNILGTKEEKDLDLICAYGAAILTPGGPTSLFDLSTDEIKSKGQMMSMGIPGLNIISVLITALICLPLIIASLILPNKLLQRSKTSLEAIKKDIGKKIVLTNSDIKKQNGEIRDKLNYFKNLRFASNTFYFTATIPSLLPKGAWLTNMSINYSSYDQAVEKNTEQTAIKNMPAQEVNISGYSHWEDKNTQFKIINNFVKNLKEDPQIGKAFDIIDLESVKSQNLENYSVTAFKIIMK
ncbi:MAG: pilus assembly protein PilM [Candidatus Omnitrophica bacterium]|nr:pilus assembly protein PilM [Candidatus Omnitrophota bacterium]